MAPKRELLTLEDREDISRGLAKGLENREIAFSIGRDESVISREIARHGGRERYRAWKADAAARESRSRPKERKIDTDPELRGRVTGDLRKGWSPEEIAGRTTTPPPAAISPGTAPASAPSACSACNTRPANPKRDQIVIQSPRPETATLTTALPQTLAGLYVRWRPTSSQIRSG